MEIAKDNLKNKWGLLGAAWGDLICSMSSVYSSDLKNILYIGAMPPEEVKLFLLTQKNIENVISINPLQHGMTYNEYLSFWSSMVGRKADLEQKITKLLKQLKIKIDYKNIINCACDIQVKYYKIEQYKNFELPSEIYSWTKSILTKYNLNKFILVNPYSFNSSPIDAHWSHWEKYLDWLFMNDNVNYIIVGQHSIFKDKFIHKKNVINLSGLTPSNLHVFGLAQFCDSVITTSNSLAHWCNAQNILCLTMMNLPGCIKFDYFFRILSGEYIYKIYFNDSLNYAKHLTTKININNYLGSKPVKRNFSIEDQLVKEQDRFLYYLTKKIDDNIVFELDNYLEKISSVSLPYNNGLINIQYANSLFKFATKMSFDNYFDFNTNNSLAILALCTGSSELKKVGWHFDKSHHCDNFDIISESISFFNKRYDKNIDYEFVKTKDDFSSFKSYTVSGIDYNIEIEYFKLLFINLLKNNVNFIIIYNYLNEPVKNKFIESWLKVFKLKTIQIENFDDLIFIDTTKNQEYLNKILLNFNLI